MKSIEGIEPFKQKSRKGFKVQGHGRKRKMIFASGSDEENGKGKNLARAL
jgi:hypothetical protein